MDETLGNLVFFVLAVPLIACAVYVVSTANAFRAGLALSAALSLIAGIFAMLSADFLAAAQILMYVGGIMVIMLFVIMLLQHDSVAATPGSGGRWIWGVLLSVAVGAYLV